MKRIKDFVKRIIESVFSPTTKRISKLSQLSQVSAALSRAAATACAREIDPADPLSWEFSGFSQNGEDGILDYLTRRIMNGNRYFIEIGASAGIENNTAWFAHARKFSGLMIDGSLQAVENGQQIATFGTDHRWLFVNKDNIDNLKELAVHKNPDVFSLDIDGIDYYIAKAILEGGFRPKIIIVEYNSAFGPTDSKTVEYKDDFRMSQMHSTELYYGVSVTGWKTLFGSHGYKFVTVDSNGVNAIFIDPTEFDAEFVSRLKGISFAENFYQLKKFKGGWEKQSTLIADMRFFSIS